MDANVQLVLSLLTILKNASAGIDLIRKHDPEAYAKASAHHHSAGVALDTAAIPPVRDAREVDEDSRS